MRLFSRLKNLFTCKTCSIVKERSYTQHDVNLLSDYWHEKVVQAKNEGRKEALKEIQKESLKEVATERHSEKEIFPSHLIYSSDKDLDRFFKNECVCGHLEYIEQNQFYENYVNSSISKGISAVGKKTFLERLRTLYKKTYVMSTSGYERGDEEITTRFIIGISLKCAPVNKIICKSMEAKKILSTFLEERIGEEVALEDIHRIYVTKFNSSNGSIAINKQALSRAIKSLFKKSIRFRSHVGEEHAQFIRNLAIVKHPTTHCV